VESEVRAMLASEKRRDDSARYPPGMEPQPGEGVGSWLHRITRPGYDLELPERGLFEMRDPYRDPD
jgi:hypothetical protein